MLRLKAHIFLTLIIHQHTRTSSCLRVFLRPSVHYSEYVWIRLRSFCWVWTLSRHKFSVCEKLSSWENTIFSFFVQLQDTCQKLTHVLHFPNCNWFEANLNNCRCVSYLPSFIVYFCAFCILCIVVCLRFWLCANNRKAVKQ